MIVACGFDHAGSRSATGCCPRSKAPGTRCSTSGPTTPQPIDYPVKALEVGRAVASGEAERGIIVCGSGAGVSVAACEIHYARHLRYDFHIERHFLQSWTLLILLPHP